MIQFCCQAAIPYCWVRQLQPARSEVQNCQQEVSQGLSLVTWAPVARQLGISALNVDPVGCGDKISMNVVIYKLNCNVDRTSFAGHSGISSSSTSYIGPEPGWNSGLARLWYILRNIVHSIKCCACRMNVMMLVWFMIMATEQLHQLENCRDCSSTVEDSTHWPHLTFPQPLWW